MCDYSTGFLPTEQNNKINERKRQGVDALSITLNPMEIRTFSCEITRHHAAK